MIERTYLVGGAHHGEPGLAREWTERVYSQDEVAALLGVPEGAKLISMSRSWWSGELTVTFEPGEASCPSDASAGGSRSGPATA